MIASTLIKLGITTLLGIFGRVATQDVLEWCLFFVAQIIVDHTDTPHDNEFLAELKKANDEAKKRGAL